MGRREEALEYLSRSLDLEPRLSNQVVGILEANAFSAEEMVEALPKHTDTLIALQQVFFDEGKGTEYLQVVEAVLDEAPNSLLIAYGSACLRAREPERLLRRLDGLVPTEDRQVEAERRLQRSRALLALGRAAGALEEAREARSLQPDEVRFGEHVGNMAMSAARPEEAVEAFRLALAQAARSKRGPHDRARLYSKIGQALDQEGKAHLAYDAYKKALDLNPVQAHAKRRVTEMEDAAGVGDTRR